MNQSLNAPQGRSSPALAPSLQRAPSSSKAPQPVTRSAQAEPLQQPHTPEELESSKTRSLNPRAPISDSRPYLLSTVASAPASSPQISNLHLPRPPISPPIRPPGPGPRTPSPPLLPPLPLPRSGPARPRPGRNPRRRSSSPGYRYASSHQHAQRSRSPSPPDEEPVRRRRASTSPSRKGRHRSPSPRRLQPPEHVRGRSRSRFTSKLRPPFQYCYVTPSPWPRSRSPERTPKRAHSPPRVPILSDHTHVPSPIVTTLPQRVQFSAATARRDPSPSASVHVPAPQVVHTSSGTSQPRAGAQHGPPVDGEDHDAKAHLVKRERELSKREKALARREAEVAKRSQEAEGMLQEANRKAEWMQEMMEGLTQAQVQAQARGAGTTKSHTRVKGQDSEPSSEGEIASPFSSRTRDSVFSAESAWYSVRTVNSYKERTNRGVARKGDAAK